ncbi:ThiF family adenylyltransferase [Candidatus Parcubacteria bacterium]|nr:ThiF family adenylyltransferase [Candidatus Parcubacteria bacterium]
MSKLEQNLSERKENFESKPQIFDLSERADQANVDKLFNDGRIQFVSDDYKEEQLELFGVKNPSKVYTPTFKQQFKEFYDNLQKNTPLWQDGKWVFYPWLSKLVHILDEDDFQLVRTARNKNLINKEEQGKFYNSTVGIGGLSVGTGVAYALVLQGGAKHLKLADMDRLALSNTNRILSGVDNLGVLKVEMAARMIYQINPYADVKLYPGGLNKDNLDEFCGDLDVMIDELDNLAVKYLIREQCSKRGIPVVMAADNGDNAVVDIERYDIDKKTPFFHGRIPGATYESLSKLDKFGIGKTITQHVGPENVTERMQQSLLEMGKTIVSWPQLGGAAMLNGAAVAYCVRKILNNQPLEANRSLLIMDAHLDPNYNSSESIEKRKTVTEGFRKIFGL